MPIGIHLFKPLKKNASFDEWLQKSRFLQRHISRLDYYRHILTLAGRRGSGLALYGLTSALLPALIARYM